MKIKIIFPTLAALFITPLSLALEQLTDEALSNVTGQDGLVLDLASEASLKGFGYDNLSLTLDSGDTGERGLTFDTTASKDFQDGIRPGFYSVNSDGLFTATPVHIRTDIDIGSDENLVPYMGVQLDIFGTDEHGNRGATQLVFGELSNLDGDKAYGSWALEGDGILRMVNQKGVFNSETEDASIFGEIVDGRLYYRQQEGGYDNTAYLIMDNLHARWDMQEGTYGINEEGIIMKAKEGGIIDVALDFDLFFKTGGKDFTPGGEGALHFGWAGGLKDPEILWRTRDGNDPHRQGVLNLSTKWNFVPSNDPIYEDNEFRWRLGETGGTSSPQAGDRRTQFELSDWATWGDHDYGHDFPMIGIDVLHDDATLGFDSELCFKGTVGNNGCSGQMVELVPGSYGSQSNVEGLAMAIRDGNLQSYSRRVNLVEEEWDATDNKYKLVDIQQYDDGNRSPGVTRSMDWGLIYTLANVDSNIFIYPGGHPEDPNKGLLADIALVSNTFEEGTNKPGFNWDHGSHLMIADTNVDGTGTGGTRNAMGIGYIGTSFVVMADDAQIMALPYDTSIPQANIDEYYGSGGLDLFSPRTRLNLFTNFGGGILPDENGSYGTGPRFVRGAVIDINLEGSVHARFSPSGRDDNALRYHWGVRLQPNDVMAATGNTGFGADDRGSYLSFAEPSRQDVAIALTNITGDMAFANGLIDIVPHDNPGDVNANPKLRASHEFLIGHAATPAIHSGSPAGAGAPLDIGHIKMGEQNLGRIVIPSAQAHATLALEPIGIHTP